MNTNTHCISPIHDIIYVASQRESKILSFDKNFGWVIEREKSYPAGKTEANIFLVDPRTNKNLKNMLLVTIF